MQRPLVRKARASRVSQAVGYNNRKSQDPGGEKQLFIKMFGLIQTIVFNDDFYVINIII
jgi:hypothetical protein